MSSLYGKGTLIFYDILLMRAQFDMVKICTHVNFKCYFAGNIVKSNCVKTLDVSIL